MIKDSLPIESGPPIEAQVLPSEQLIIKSFSKAYIVVKILLGQFDEALPNNTNPYFFPNFDDAKDFIVLLRKFSSNPNQTFAIQICKEVERE